MDRVSKPHIISSLFIVPHCSFLMCAFLYRTNNTYLLWTISLKMMKLRLKSKIPALLIFVIFLLPIMVRGHKESNLHSLKLKLIHRHDPRLSHYNMRTISQLERLQDLAHKDFIRYSMISHRLRRRRSHGRKDYETSVQMPMHGGKDHGVGEYFVQVKVGTPAQRFWLIADTGSELTWINCRYKCGKNCSTHRGRSKVNSRRLFYADQSSTFETVTCTSMECKVNLRNLFSLTTCPNPSDPCQYDFSYLDGSSAMGFFAKEVITMRLSSRRKTKLFNVLVGCTQSTQGGLFNEATDGVLGLGYSKDSFAVKAAQKYGGKFSYCLVDHLSPQNVSNYLSFGDHLNYKKTKLLSDLRYTKLSFIGSSYGVQLSGISVGDELLTIPDAVWDVNVGGGTLLDSGTSLTLLPQPAYDPVVAALEMSLTRYERLKTRMDPFEYCFNATGFNETLLPRVIIHFADGARFEPPVKSYIIDVSPQTKCIGFIPTPSPSPSIIGNILQQNHIWEFDILQQTLGFAPSSCTS